jgi:hypothetical protein
MEDRLATLTHEIEALLEAPSSGDTAPSPEHVEETLTTGYARALELEARRARLERQIGEEAAAPEPSVPELSALAKERSRADRELQRLRGLLESLRRRNTYAGPET